MCVTSSVIHFFFFEIFTRRICAWSSFVETKPYKKILHVKLRWSKIFLYAFCMQKYFTVKKRIRVCLLRCVCVCVLRLAWLRMCIRRQFMARTQSGHGTVRYLRCEFSSHSWSQTCSAKPNKASLRHSWSCDWLLCYVTWKGAATWM